MTRPGSNISSSAPPSYRARPKPKDEEPENKNRLTGPPMQMGAGKGSMFANGRMGQPQGRPVPSASYPQPGNKGGMGTPQGSIPRRTPNYPQPSMGGHGGGQAQGMHPRGVPTATRMMADGGIGSPDPIGGGMPDQEPDADDMQAGPSAAGAPPVIKPEAVNYHDEAHACSGCTYFDQGSSQCSVLQMQVQPEGGCNAFEAIGGDQGASPDMSGGMPVGDDGTSGAPQLG